MTPNELKDAMLVFSEKKGHTPWVLNAQGEIGLRTPTQVEFCPLSAALYAASGRLIDFSHDDDLEDVEYDAIRYAEGNRIPKSAEFVYGEAFADRVSAYRKAMLEVVKEGSKADDTE